jgi:two-component sensor histidine kinase/Tfp pilus assembly protein PilF
MNKPALLLFLFAISFASRAQQPIDSLKSLLFINETKGDSALIKYYTAYIGYYYHSYKSYDSALSYYNKILRQRSSWNNTTLLATTLNGVGACYNGLGYPDSSLNNYTKALYFFNLLKDTTRVIDVEANMAIVYKDIGLYEKALETAFVLLAKLLTRKPDRALASCYNTIALVYESTDDFQNALHYHRKALLVRKGLQYRKGEAQTYHNIGEVYRSMGKYDSALTNLLRALKIKTELTDEHATSSTLSSIGRVYLDIDKPIMAEEYFVRSLSITRKLNDKPGQAVTLKDLGRLKITLNRYQEASQLLSESERLSRETKLINNLRENLELKIDLLKRSGEYSKALSASQELFIIRDSMLTIEKAKNMKSLEIRYETERKEHQITLLEQRDKANLATLQRKQAQIKSLSAGVFLLFIITGLIFYNARITRKSKSRIETLHKELHHRVKNYLQMLSSILGLQAEQLTDANAINSARSTESRINAMALIHKKLYNVDDNRSIDIRSYVYELINYLMHAYGFNDNSLKLTIAIPKLDVDVDKVIPLGLILNELISNALKYAFIDHTDPELKVTIQKHQNKLQLLVGDNGLGFDNEVIGTNGSFGLKMVGMLVKEMRGNFSVQIQNGTQYILNIPIG